MSQINTIHFLVFPTSYGKTNVQKKGRWLKNIGWLRSARNTLFVMLREKELGLQRGNLLPVEKELIKAGKILGNRFIEGHLSPDLIYKIVNGHILSKNVEIIAYGQHAGVCVSAESKCLADGLQRCFPKKTFRIREVPQYSAKTKANVFKNLLKRHRPDLLAKINDVELNELADAYMFGGFRNASVWGLIRNAKDKRPLFKFFGISHRILRPF